MAAIVTAAKARFGHLDGVIHSAGVAGGGMMQLKSRETAAGVLAPKVAGARVLEELLRDEPLRFFAICSSLASVYGGFGQVDYCAANNYLDAFAREHTTPERPVISIGWDTWREVGMAVNTEVPLELQQSREESLERGIAPEEGVQAFLGILEARLPHVAVCTTDLQASLEKSTQHTAGHEFEARPETIRAAHPRPALTTPYAVPETEMQETLAGMWQDLLGMAPIGVHDNFFELGGHSLLAVQMISQLRTHFEVEMTVQSLFDLPTVARLAERVETLTGELPDLETVARLLEAGGAAFRGRGEGAARQWTCSSGGAPMSPKTARDQVHLNKRIAGLSPERKAILEQLMRQEQQADTSIRPRDRGQDPPPLAFAQEQLWFLDQLAPGNWFYNESSALLLTFPVNTAVMQKALNEIARRHETLRTTFVTVAGELVQSIAPEFTVPLVEIDLTGQSPAERQAEARRVAAEDAQNPFDLAVGPLIRTTLLRMSKAESIFLLTMHHIIFDGWSFTILLRELNDIYEAFAAGWRSPLPELTIQYADFAVWQRRWLRGEALEAKLGYWRKQLANLPLLHLPTDYPRPAVQSFQGARCPVVLPRTLCDEVRALSVLQGMTPFMTLLTAFQALLHRYAGDDEIVVGIPVANRDRVEIEGLIGFFVNTLVMRTDMSGNPTFREALGRVRKVALEAFEHQDVPFEKLVEELQPQRDLSRNPMFQVTFQVYGSNGASAVGGEPATLLDNAASPFDVDARTAKFDLRFDLAEHNGGLNGFLEYDTALFEPETIARMARHFQRLLECAVDEPGRRISELALLTAAERFDLLVERNNTATAYPRENRIHDLFEAQMEPTPCATAVEFDGETLTYAELNCRANRLAHYLARLGVGRETPVGISGERSFEMIVGLLAILKAGGVYVPLDLDEPRERLLRAVQDAGVRVVLTRERQLFHLSNQGVQVIPLSLETDRYREGAGPQPIDGWRCGGPGVFHLHVGVDGPAEGRGSSAAGGRAPGESRRLLSKRAREMYSCNLRRSRLMRRRSRSGARC